MKPWWLRIAPYARPQAGGLAGVVLLMLLGVGLEALKPWPMKLLVDSALGPHPLPASAAWVRALPGADRSVGLTGWLAGATVLLFLLTQAATISQAYLKAGVGRRMVYSLGESLFVHLQKLSPLFHTGRRTGDLVRRVTKDSECVRELLLNVFLPVFSVLTSLVTMFAVMWALDPSLCVVALLVTPLMGWVIHRLTRSMTERMYHQYELEGEVMALAEQTLTALPVVQAFGREELEDDRFRDLSQRTVGAYVRSMLAQLRFKVGVGSVTAVGQAVVMGVGGMYVLQGRLTLGSLLVFLSYLTALYAPLETLAYLSSGFATAAAGARRVLDVLDAEERVVESPTPKPLPDLPSRQRGHVVLEGVTFGYDPERPVLREISLEARPGETIALVGHTGAGKSTLVSLLPRFFDPQQGRVLLDGVEVRDLRLSELRAQFSLVLQEPFLLPLTIAENIAYGRPDASREEIEAAARAANADGFIERLPQGYDTVVGERGATLSGGEKQRLAIARALLKDAPVLILDEPTSALDAETEGLLLEALGRLMQGRTTFIIAHRLSTIRNADRILVLAGSGIVERDFRALCMPAESMVRRHSAEANDLRPEVCTPAPTKRVELRSFR